MKQIILYRKGSISQQDKAALKSEGYLPVACADMNDVTVLLPDAQRLKGDDIFQAAIKALSGANSYEERRQFGSEIIRKLLVSQAKP